MPDAPPIISTWNREALAPVAAAERIEVLDTLRGFALLGILTVNMALFSWPVYLVYGGGQGSTTWIDWLADMIVRLFAEGKFYPLFSFLFGIGVAIQMERAEMRGTGFLGFFCRRMTVLLGIGLVHAFCIWEGDILVMYAVFGFLLPVFRKCKPVTMLIVAGICLLLPVGIYAACWLLVTVGSLVPEVAETIEREFAKEAELYAQRAEENLRAFAEGNVAEVFVQRAKNVLFMWQYAWFYAPTFFAMFLTGMYAGRRRIFHNIEANAAFFRRVLVWGLAVGLPANAIYTICYGMSNPLDLSLVLVISVAAIAAGGPALCLAYVAAFSLLMRRETWRRRLQPVAAAGRMALSNYLLQSLICTTVFYSHGLGWYGSVGRLAGLGLAVLIYAAQIPFSVWWLKRFQFGPAEWLWRTLTYGKRQPLRRSVSQPAGCAAL